MEIRFIGEKGVKELEKTLFEFTATMESTMIKN